MLAIKSTYTTKTIVQLARRKLNAGTSKSCLDRHQQQHDLSVGINNTVNVPFPFKSSGNAIPFG
ncbi:MAG: hypothetical protein U0894_13860 [Pirellulales bacterium]